MLKLFGAIAEWWLSSWSDVFCHLNLEIALQAESRNSELQWSLREALPSGKLLHSYGKWPCIVELCWFSYQTWRSSIVVLVYQRVTAWVSCGYLIELTQCHPLHIPIYHPLYCYMCPNISFCHCHPTFPLVLFLFCKITQMFAVKSW